MNTTLFAVTKPVAIEEEMKRSYLDYAMSVIVSRALPDVRDGLKPVHRRILYAMKNTGNDYNKPYRKSMRVVGEVIGKYHPHGDSAIYDAMVRLAQDFSLRVPLIDGQGNFGSLDGDPAAAARYTEARLSKIAHALLEDIEKQTVDFKPNYDESEVEPCVLPARFPNLLVNGTSGIAVGMATSIPTHNLSEILQACCLLIDHPESTLMDVINIVKGPDFPTGGIIMGRAAILEAYKTGRAIIMVRGRATVESHDKRESIVITEIPYQVNKARLVEKIAELVKEKTIEGITDLRDESNRQGVRIVIELRRDAVGEVILNQLYRYSQLQTTISFNMLALRHGRPEQLNLLDVLHAFLEFREEVITRRIRFELQKAREKAHILLGFAVAVSHIDEMIILIKQAKDRPEAKERIMAKGWDSGKIISFLELLEEKISPEGTYFLSDIQANGILDLRLHRLTGLERDKIQQDLQDTVAIIKDLLDILSSRPRLLGIMKDELVAIQENHPTPRRTEIEESDLSIDDEDLIQKEEMVVTVSIEGYIKRVPLSTYRSQKRGGKGRSGMTTKAEDDVRTVLVANTHSYIYFFSTHGKVYRMKVYKLPQGSPVSPGRALINLLPLAVDEKIATIMIEPDDLNREETYLMFATSYGNVRRNKMHDFENINANGKRAIRLDEGESLVAVSLCSEQDDVMLSAASGLCNRFNVTNIRVFQGRDSNGVRGIRLSEGDQVISMLIVASDHLESVDERDTYLKTVVRKIVTNDAIETADSHEELMTTEPSQETDEEEAPSTLITITPERMAMLQDNEQFVLTVSENGMGKCSSAYEYRATNRGSKGYDAMRITKKTGGLVSMLRVNPTDEMILVTNKGQMIRCSMEGMRVLGRRSLGVILFRIDGDEKIVAVSVIESLDHDDTTEIAS